MDSGYSEDTQPLPFHEYAWVARQPIGLTRVAVLFHLASAWNSNTHRCFPSAVTIADRIGAGERTVRRAFDDLETLGLICRQRTRYSFRFTLMLDKTTTRQEVENLDREPPRPAGKSGLRSATQDRPESPVSTPDRSDSPVSDRPESPTNPQVDPPTEQQHARGAFDDDPSADAEEEQPPMDDHELDDDPAIAQAVALADARLDRVRKLKAPKEPKVTDEQRQKGETVLALIVSVFDEQKYPCLYDANQRRTMVAKLGRIARPLDEMISVYSTLKRLDLRWQFREAVIQDIKRLCTLDGYAAVCRAIDKINHGNEDGLIPVALPAIPARTPGVVVTGLDAHEAKMQRLYAERRKAGRADD